MTSGSEAMTAVVADDLTGALDSAVKFAESGWLAELVLDPDAQPSARPGSVIAVTTDVRTGDDAAAEERTAAAVSAFVDAGAQRLLVKIDSTIRGTVGAQVAGALRAWRVARPRAIAVVCPAYPAMTRTVRDGTVLVDGERVDETWMADDPVTPVRDARLTHLVAGSVAIGEMEVEDLVARLREAQDARETVVVDASDEEGLLRIARAARRIGPDAVLVGSAGIAEAVARDADAAGVTETATPVVSRPFVIASSLHERTHEQLDRLISRHPALTTLEPALRDLESEQAVADWVERAGTGRLDRPALLRTPRERASDAAGGAPIAISQRLALAASMLIARLRPDLLLLMGGEGARAVLRRIGARGIRIHREIRQGMPLGSIVGGALDSTPIITKAGGFGQPDDVADALFELAAPVLERQES